MNKLVILGFLLLPFSLILKNGLKNSFSANTRHEVPYQSLKDGEAIYKKYCISCHQADGGGVPHMAPPLIQTKYVLGDKVALAKIVLNGLQGVEIKGQTYNNPMPPLGSVLKDKEIADVLSYVRNSFGNKASKVLPSEVKEAREDNKTVLK
jgi:mono/diheme cytochrome c family protein